jgi:hypothetical protein
VNRYSGVPGTFGSSHVIIVKFLIINEGIVYDNRTILSSILISLKRKTYWSQNNGIKTRISILLVFFNYQQLVLYFLDVEKYIERNIIEFFS